MATFRSYRSFWEFQNYVQRSSRYIFDDRTKGFLDTLVATSADRRREFRKGQTFWRAQAGHGWETVTQDRDEFEVPGPYEPKRMAPLEYEAVEGRANPKGIPYLYVATDKETAMAEVRPFVGEYISVGQFKLKEDIALLDCSIGSDSRFKIYFEEPSPEEKEKAVWGDLDRAFSEPVTANESRASYVPTQIVAEVFKNEGYDGIGYKSSLGKGFNVVLFNLESVSLLNCHLFQVKSLSYVFEQAANSYFIKMPSDQKKPDS